MPDPRGEVDWAVWEPAAPHAPTMFVKAATASLAAQAWGQRYAEDIHRCGRAVVYVARAGDERHFVRYAIAVRRVFAVETAIIEERSDDSGEDD